MGLRPPCPRTGAQTSAIPIEVEFQHMLLSPTSLSQPAARESAGAAAADAPLLCHETTSTERGRKGPKNPHLPCFAFCTSLPIRAGGSQEKDSGEFANVPLPTPSDINRMSSTQHKPTPCYITEPLQCCKMQGERGQGNGQEPRAECLRDTDHYTLLSKGRRQRRQFEWKQYSNLEGKGSRGEQTKGVHIYLMMRHKDKREHSMSELPCTQTWKS